MLQIGESADHRRNLLIRMLYDLLYGKLNDISNEEQPSVGQRSGYNVPLKRTAGRLNFEQDAGHPSQAKIHTLTACKSSPDWDGLRKTCYLFEC